MDGNGVGACGTIWHGGALGTHPERAVHAADRIFVGSQPQPLGQAPAVYFCVQPAVPGFICAALAATGKGQIAGQPDLSGGDPGAVQPGAKSGGKSLSDRCYCPNWRAPTVIVCA